jgi:hypothetical protein
MPKSLAILFAALAIAAVGFIVGLRPDPNAGSTGSTGALVDAGVADAGRATPGVDAGDAGDPSGSDEPGPDVNGTDAGATLLNGSAAPGLAADAPKSVVFGVILVVYKGAQLAPPSSRTREAALELAKQLAVEAKTDFKAAVAKGDKGSMENAGRMTRGALEPAPEFVLFSLPKDGVSDPVDTPRGFWIVHRIE